MPIRPDPFGSFLSGRLAASQEFRANAQTRSRLATEALTRAIQLQTAPLRVQTLQQQLEAARFANSQGQRDLETRRIEAGIQADETRLRASELEIEALKREGSPEALQRARELEQVNIEAARALTQQRQASAGLSRAEADRVRRSPAIGASSASSGTTFQDFVTARQARDAANATGNTVDETPASVAPNTLTQFGASPAQVQALQEIQVRQSSDIPFRPELRDARIRSIFPNADDATFNRLVQEVEPQAAPPEPRTFAQIETDVRSFAGTQRGDRQPFPTANRPAIDTEFESQARDRFQSDVDNGFISQEELDLILEEERRRGFLTAPPQ